MFTKIAALDDFILNEQRTLKYKQSLILKICNSKMTYFAFQTIL